MKQYYTLVQSFIPENLSLGDYLEDRGIKYELGAERYDELQALGYYNPGTDRESIMKTFRVLIEEHELSAIMLSVDGVSKIQNRPGTDLRNKIRSQFSWFLD